uniref:Uncharacterized protein n=1 Tax=Rhizophora mucronata TaxID=61149 RepID=A0A2P2QQQ5_RHIMU
MSCRTFGKIMVLPSGQAIQKKRLIGTEGFQG